MLVTVVKCVICEKPCKRLERKKRKRRRRKKSSNVKRRNGEDWRKR